MSYVVTLSRIPAAPQRVSSFDLAMKIFYIFSFKQMGMKGIKEIFTVQNRFGKSRSFRRKHAQSTPQMAKTDHGPTSPGAHTQNDVRVLRYDTTSTSLEPPSSGAPPYPFLPTYILGRVRSTPPVCPWKVCWGVGQKYIDPILIPFQFEMNPVYSSGHALAGCLISVPDELVGRSGVVSKVCDWRTTSLSQSWTIARFMMCWKRYVEMSGASRGM